MEPPPALEQPHTAAKRATARRARGRNVRGEPTGDNVASGTKINRNIIPSSRLGASIHKYGNGSGRQHESRTEKEVPAESPQEGGAVR
jgi:hypothetical protein